MNFWRDYIFNQWQTTVHKFWVAFYISIFALKLLKRAFVHDFSKYQKFEACEFAKYIHDLKKTEYGSPEYAAMLKKMEPCLEHHYKNNSHHPQFYPDGFAGMGALDRIEMVADWMAAVRRNKNGSVNKSLEINQKRFGYSDDDLNWLRLLVSAYQGTDRSV